MASRPAPLIENHGVIGNMRSAALVSIDGAIDFFCFPSFDSPTIFAALLDPEKGGSFSIVPHMEDPRTRQIYLPDTNILLTRYLSEEGVAEVTDFMPVTDVLPDADGKDDAEDEDVAYAHQLIRMVRVIKGEVRFSMRCAPRFDYARCGHAACKEGDSVCFHAEGEHTLASMALHATVPLQVDKGDAFAEFVLRPGETAAFAFGKLKKEEVGQSKALQHEAVEQMFDNTIGYWRTWIGQSVYKGRWRETVNRSALVLKLLSSQKYGPTIAAVTFGLPEQAGGSRNWDYRYTWLRDASFALYAFVRLGFTQEVRGYTPWLRDRLMHGLEGFGEDGPLLTMYRVSGTDDLGEETLDHLCGYKDSRPVRVGNAAVSQLQLDIYGELMDAIYLANKYSDGISKDGWRRIGQTLDWLKDNWNRPDEGIWEMRNGRQHMLHSRLMCWVAFDRALRLMDKRSLSGDKEMWRKVRDEINDDILDNFWSEKLKSFVRSKGSEELDASLLLMPMMRFIGPTDPRWLSTMEAIEKNLAEDSLVFRYRSDDDGLPGEESSFIACSFWYIECLARAHKVDKARMLFDKMLGYANHLGLYSEELGSNGDFLGNFPQALSHLALISAATYLDRAIDGIKETWT